MIQVEVELKRIQTFLFQVPRLKAMLGANALVGETMRVELAKLARPLTEKQTDNFGFADYPDDPLQSTDPELPDSPGRAYSEGILARDGGHFSALFPNEVNAKRFIEQAEALISTRLPGVLFDIRHKEFGGERTKPSSHRRVVEATLDLPTFQICTATGQGPAASSENTGGEKRYLSLAAKLREEAGKRFYQGETEDMIGLLRGEFGLDHGEPNDLSDIADGGYLALIHADGNKVGEKFSQWRQRQETGLSALQREARGERFFHSLRVAVRQAAVEAVQTTFSQHTGSKGQRLYQPLMLGGDDLVMVCRADLALTFCKRLAQAIDKHKLVDGSPLTLGIGVAIAKDGYPFYRLHELAEELAGSAKRRTRAASSTDETSVIDWQVVTQSSFHDLDATRRRADLIEYQAKGQRKTLILNQRPYRILAGDDQSGNSLETLLDAAKYLVDKGVARSALRGLRAEFEKGKLHGELAFANLLDSNKEVIEKATHGRLCAEKPWQEIEPHTFATPLFDLIELTELEHLGKRKSQ